MTFQYRFDASRVIRQNSEAEERYFRAGQWFRAALLHNPEADAFCAKAKGLPIIKAQSEGVNTAGGVLVPTEVEDLIIANRQVAGVARREARQAGMKGDLLTTPRRTSGLTASFAAEAATMTDSDIGLDTVGLTARKLYTFTKMSSELDEDAATFGKFITEEIGFAFASKEDDCLFNGDASATYAGMTGICPKILGGTSDAAKVTATGHSTFATITAADLGSLVAAIPEQYLESAKWYASSYAIGNLFVRLGATVGCEIMTPSGPRPQMQFMGWPIVPTPKMQGSGTLTGLVSVLFGDMSRAATLGSARGVIVKVSEHIYFTNDQLAVKGTERFDVVAHVGDNTTAIGVVGLVGG